MVGVGVQRQLPDGGLGTLRARGPVPLNFYKSSCARDVFRKRIKSGTHHDRFVPFVLTYPGTK
jgi:hypothetical protein